MITHVVALPVAAYVCWKFHVPGHNVNDLMQNVHLVLDYHTTTITCIRMNGAEEALFKVTDLEK